MAALTHAQLVAKAEKWLRNGLNCRVVFCEPVSAAWEQPDVIGWIYGRSVVVECKTSRADFKADLQKHFRKMPDNGLGYWRFYLTEPGLLDGLDLPEGWGWYEVRGRTVSHKAGVEYKNVGGAPFTTRQSAEIDLLLSAIHRLSARRDLATLFKAGGGGTTG
jgi:hypothetical protein